MALKHGKPNPLNLLDLRRVHFPARHFYYITLGKFNTNRVYKIDNWIFNNLNGRYYVGQSIGLDNKNIITYYLNIGFEEEKELSFFLLAYSEI